MLVRAVCACSWCGIGVRSRDDATHGCFCAFRRCGCLLCQPPYEPENEAMDGLIICSSKPPCPPESNIAKKRKRYITWINNPELIEQDMDKYRAALHQIHEEYKEILEDELRWSDAFFVVRRHLLAQINLLDEEMKVRVPFVWIV